MERANFRPTIVDNHNVPGCHVDKSGARSRAMRRVLIRVLLVTTPLLPMAGHAEDVSSQTVNDQMPQCGPQMDGQVYCRFGVLYECQLIGANSMERRTG